MVLTTAHPVAASKPPRVAPAAAPRPSPRPMPHFTAPPSGREFYFGFGANMAPRVRQARQLNPESVTPVTLPNHKLYFNHIGGYASIEYRPEATTRPDVHGVLLDLSKAEMNSLADLEKGYDVKPVVVTDNDGKQYAAKAFVSNWSVRLFEESFPTQDYIEKLREGAAKHELPAEYQAWLQGIQGRSSVIPREEEEVLASPASYLAIGFSAVLFFGACMLLVGPPRR